MAEASFRRFSLLDALILIAATAAGFAWWRISVPVSLYEGFLGEIQQEGSLRENLRRLLWIFLYAHPMLTAWTAGILLLRLRSPRPRLRRLARQPGFAAECAVLAGLAVTAGEYAGWRIAGCGFRQFAILTLRGQTLTELLDEWLIFSDSLRPIASAVGAVWGLMILGRVLRPEKSWIDRSGRALGVLWLLMYLIEIATMLSD